MEIARKFGHLKSKKCQDSNRSCWVRSANATSVLCALPIALFCAIKLHYLYHTLNFWWIFILPGRTLCRPSYSSLQREKLCHQQRTDQPPASCRRWRGRGIRRAPLWKVDVKLDWWLKLGFGTSTSELIHLKLSSLLTFYNLHYLKRRHRIGNGSRCETFLWCPRLIFFWSKLELLPIIASRAPKRPVAANLMLNTGRKKFQCNRKCERPAKVNA